VSTISIPTPAPGHFLVLEGVDWELYESVRKETDDAGNHVRITYDNGRMVLMSPGDLHEFTKKRIGRMIEMATFEWQLPVISAGSTTWKRRDLAVGLEADECYYIQRESEVRGKRLDLLRGPPPDLVVEVDVTSSSREKEKIYAALGVNEIWRFDGKRTAFLKLRGRQYRSIKESDALPPIAPADIDRHLAMFQTMNETAIFREFAKWVRSIKK